MAEHEPVTPDDGAVVRAQSTWDTFTKFSKWATYAVVAVLAVMAMTLVQW